MSVRNASSSIYFDQIDAKKWFVASVNTKLISEIMHDLLFIEH